VNERIDDARGRPCSGTRGRQTACNDGKVPSRFAVLVIDAIDPDTVAEFWCAVLDWRVVERSEEGVSIAAPDGGWPTIDILPVPEGKTIKNRLHLDLRADGVSTEVELDRLRRLGAQQVDVGQPSDSSWVVLTDPEGNEFCLLSRPVQDI
jgi:hypothetical protein